MKIYENFLIAGDFNSEMTDSAMEKFCVAYHLHNLSKDPACFKNPDQPSCIDLLLTNFSKSFLKFRTELLSAMERHSNISFADFHSEFLYLFGKHASVKKRYIRANQKNFIDKELNQPTMVRSKLRNKFFKLS